MILLLTPVLNPSRMLSLIPNCEASEAPVVEGCTSCCPIDDGIKRSDDYVDMSFILDWLCIPLLLTLKKNIYAQILKYPCLSLMFLRFILST